ncbi:hypothetical protein HDU85_004020 [Gaertneriomyces sp. JEL0708]|nr:hypothetical protein HDU85_004020 [Gaertneriomyces sp. JEL0708]
MPHSNSHLIQSCPISTNLILITDAHGRILSATPDAQAPFLSSPTSSSDDDGDDVDDDYIACTSSSSSIVGSNVRQLLEWVTDTDHVRDHDQEGVVLVKVKGKDIWMQLCRHAIQNDDNHPRTASNTDDPLQDQKQSEGEERKPLPLDRDLDVDVDLPPPSLDDTSTLISTLASEQPSARGGLYVYFLEDVTKVRDLAHVVSAHTTSPNPPTSTISDGSQSRIPTANPSSDTPFIILRINPFGRITQAYPLTTFLSAPSQSLLNRFIMRFVDDRDLSALCRALSRASRAGAWAAVKVRWVVSQQPYPPPFSETKGPSETRDDDTILKTTTNDTILKTTTTTSSMEQENTSKEESESQEGGSSLLESFISSSRSTPVQSPLLSPWIPIPPPASPPSFISSRRGSIAEASSSSSLYSPFPLIGYDYAYDGEHDVEELDCRLDRVLSELELGGGYFDMDGIDRGGDDGESDENKVRDREGGKGPAVISGRWTSPPLLPSPAIPISLPVSPRSPIPTSPVVAAVGDEALRTKGGSGPTSPKSVSLQQPQSPHYISSQPQSPRYMHSQPQSPHYTRSQPQSPRYTHSQPQSPKHPRRLSLRSPKPSSKPHHQLTSPTSPTSRTQPSTPTSTTTAQKPIYVHITITPVPTLDSLLLLIQPLHPDDGDDNDTRSSSTTTTAKAAAATVVAASSRLVAFLTAPIAGLLTVWWRAADVAVGVGKWCWRVLCGVWWVGGWVVGVKG